MKRRLSTPRAATVVVLAAAVAASVTVVPSVAQSFLTNQQASHIYVTNQKASKLYVSNKKASTLYLKKKAATNLYLAKATAPKPTVSGIAAGTAQFGPISATTAGYIPSAFTSFATKATVSNAVITFSGNVTCTSAKPTAAQSCPVQILVDGQVTGKLNLGYATLASPAPIPVVQTATITTVLTKGGHTISVQYAGAKDVTFTLKGWNLAVVATPQPEEVVEDPTITGSGGSKDSK